MNDIEIVVENEIHTPCNSRDEKEEIDEAEMTTEIAMDSNTTKFNDVPTADISHTDTVNTDVFWRLTRGFSIRPRFDSATLNSALGRKIQEIKVTPIEVYEIELYDICRRFYKQESRHKISNKCILYVHHIYRLKSQEIELNEDDSRVTNQSLENLMSCHPRYWGDYSFYKETLALVSILAVKWKIVTLDNYNYRLKGRGLNIKLLDLNEMNSDMFTMETLWWANNIKTHPWVHAVGDELLQVAELLIKISPRILNELISCNQNCDFEAFPSISPFLAVKKPAIVKYTKVKPDFNINVMTYQRLKIKNRIFSLCLKDDESLKLKSIYGMIADFEMAYRKFEQDLMVFIIKTYQLTSKNLEESY
ncbi:unnamed protein product [Blepharisma stoltei]|uniref:Uncharacterized protein n=1 Tax=Blepharisma stoltei TaxID=1481888 RepID=A0AAU9IYK3_9CILI|nr:unnamed protein product [Blepharisma stoltei]